MTKQCHGYPWAPMAEETQEGHPCEPETAGRFESEIVAALRRRAANEAQLAGALRVLAPHSPRLASLVIATLDTLVRRASFARPLYSSHIRALGEFDHLDAAGILTKALMADTAGDLATLSACCFEGPTVLGGPLARVATSRHPHRAFVAQLARVIRGESNGESLHAIAAKTKEAHRIELCGGGVSAPALA